MIRSSKFLLFLGLFSGNLFACEINFYQKTYFLGDRNSITPSDLIETTTCPEDITKNALDLVLDSNGPLKGSYLEKAMEPPTIKITPNKIEVIPLITLISLPPNWIWENLKTLSGQSIFHQKDLTLVCTTCSTLGKKALEIKTGRSSFWINGDLKTVTKVLISKNAMPSSKFPLESEDFTFEDKAVTDPNEYFTSIEDLKYYRLNLDITEGTLLKKSNLRKIDLINPGTPATLKFSSNGISVKGIGIPMSSGKIGEIVKIKNPKSNTILYGKVIGENTLSVDL